MLDRQSRSVAFGSGILACRIDMWMEVPKPVVNRSHPQPEVPKPGVNRLQVSIPLDMRTKWDYSYQKTVSAAI